MRNLFIIGLLLIIIHFFASLIGLVISGHDDEVHFPQRVWVNGEFRPFGILTPIQVEGTKSTTISDSITVTQNYVWGQDFKKVSMVSGQEAKTKQWSDSLIKGLGSPKRANVDYFYGEGDLAKAAHGRTLEDLLKGKTFTAMSVTGFASPEASEPSSLLKECIDAKNVVLAKERAAMTSVILKRLFNSNSKDISGIKTTLSGVEAQLPEAIANGLATEKGFQAVIASNRASKDTLGFKAFTELSKRRFTAVKLNYTEEKRETMVITQPFLIPLLLLWLLWNLLRKISTPTLTGERRAGSSTRSIEPTRSRWTCCKLPNFSWPSFGTCAFPKIVWPTFSCKLPKLGCKASTFYCSWPTCVWPTIGFGCCIWPRLEGGHCCLCKRGRNGKLRWRCCWAINRWQWIISLKEWWQRGCTCCIWKLLLLISVAINIWFYLNRC